MALVSRAWMIDPLAFHADVSALVAANELHERAVEVWHTTDPVARTYLELLRTAPPDEWEASSDSENGEWGHVVEWYRTVMAPYATPTRAFRAPEQLKRRLPDLGWSPSEARRLAQGRELQLFVQTYADPATADRLAPHFELDSKGWLGPEDVTGTLDRMRRLDRGLFRNHPDLVELVEHVYEVLEAAATKPDAALVMLAD